MYNMKFLKYQNLFPEYLLFNGFSIKLLTKTHFKKRHFPSSVLINMKVWQDFVKLLEY